MDEADCFSGCWEIRQIWAGSETLACAYGDSYIFCGLLSGEVEAYSLRSGGRLALRYRPQQMAIRSLAVQPMDSDSKIKVVTGGQDGLIRQVGEIFKGRQGKLGSYN